MSDVLFDSANSDDLHGERFVRLWERYSREMRLHAWGGNAEMSAVAHLYFVNFIIWKVTPDARQTGTALSGIAAVEAPILAGPPNAPTHHIRWVNEKHYEPTTIPSSFMPILVGSSASAAAPLSQDQDGGSPAIRSSARVRTPKRPHDA